MKKQTFTFCLLLCGIFTLSAQVALNRTNKLPEWAFGGFVRAETNPVITPLPTEFYCPMRKTMLKWEESDTFNPAAVVKDGKIVVLYRAEDNSAQGIGRRTSRIGYAESTDGITMTRRNAPVLYPGEDDFKSLEWEGGCEDPRVAVTEDGLYVMFYTAWNRSVARLAVATSTDLIHWNKHGLAFEQAYNGRFNTLGCKSASIVTKLENDRLVIAQLNGQYWMYWGEDAVYAATSDDLIHWNPVLDNNNELKKLAVPRAGYFDSRLTECGPPAILTENGILLLYNGKNDSNDSSRDPNYTPGAYAAGQMLFDLENPQRLIQRLDVPFFRPMADFERSGQYNDGGTVFIEGLTYYNGRWFLYYGCADSKVGVAIFDPQQPADGDPVFDIPEETGNGIAPWPFAGLGNHPVSIHSFSSQTKGSEGAFNLLYHHIDRNKKWCDDKTTKPWVVFELTDYYNIEKFVFRDVAPYEEGNGNVPEYWLYTSVTGTATGDWKEIAHKTNQASVDVKEVVFVVPEEARYLKLVVSRGTRTDNNNPENAVRIYGCDIYGSFSSKIDRGDLISAGKTVVDYFSAPFYYEAPLHLLDGNKTNNSAKWTFQRPDVIDSLRWVIVDLEDNYNISQFKIYDSHSIGSNTNNISRYNIYLRSSAPDFNLISSNEDRNEGWNQVVSAAGRKSEDIKTDAITPVEGRFVKLEIPRSGISGTTNLYEFEIFGTKATNGISANNPLMKIYAQNSTLFVESAEASAIRIYDVSGRQLRTLTGKSGLTAINGLPAKGLYIVRTDRLTSKITL